MSLVSVYPLRNCRFEIKSIVKYDTNENEMIRYRYIYSHCKNCKDEFEGIINSKKSILECFCYYQTGTSLQYKISSFSITILQMTNDKRTENEINGINGIRKAKKANDSNKNKIWHVEWEPVPVHLLFRPFSVSRLTDQKVKNLAFGSKKKRRKFV